MIPSDVATRLKPLGPELQAPLPAAAAKELTDVLSELVPGQRIMAEIQALLPNGTYRALVSQRDITLALPFSAKPGDSLELEVVDKEGKLTLAVVTNRTDASAASGLRDSVPAKLSQTGQFIGNLLADISPEGKKAQPAPLNGNQPLAATFPSSGSELVPLLKQAITSSGMFYESHQARWVEGQLTKESLLQEPQGKLSSPVEHQVQTPSLPVNTNTAIVQQSETSVSSATGNIAKEAPSAPPQTYQNPIHPELTPLVQQQLDALATQNYVWQGQVWQGQEMYWEISEDPHRPRSDGDEDISRWKTTLRLDLPTLGGIDATLRLLPGNQIDISVTTNNAATVDLLTSARDNLREQLQSSAGLGLTALSISKNGESSD